MAGLSNTYENLVLDHLTGKASLSSPTANGLYLALTTVAVGETDTGSTITEANYSGYARKQIVPGDMTSAASGETHNNTTETFVDVASGSSTVIGWALCTAASAGSVVIFGTCSSTTVSTTQTPPTVAASALSLSLD